MSLSKTHRILLGLSAVTGVATFYFTNNQKNRAHASWTTNYMPSPFAKWDENWDHRSPKFSRTPKEISNESDENRINEEREQLRPRVCRHLILIRHGQYNLDGTTDKERILTKLGRLQAEYTGKRLKELNFPYTEMVKSTMARAQETGHIISQSLPDIPVTDCDFIREGAPIPPEPPLEMLWREKKLQKTVLNISKQADIHDKLRRQHVPKQHKEKFYQDGSRIEAAFRKYFYRAEPNQEKDSYTLLVCHANVIRYFVCRALQFPAEAWLRLSLNHASITWITITPSGRCVLRVLGDTGHMPPNVITTT